MVDDDPESAIADYESTQSYYPEAGEAPAHTYHWLYDEIAWRASNRHRQPDSNYPAAMAFKTTIGVINYVVYNYQNSDVNVTFSDSTVVNAPNSFSIKSISPRFARVSF